ncbi:MAG: AAA family ATPase, partial [Prevotellaceae bacterium]|nr:AAA family ATPase [Prevotellaceae bacterium]
MLNSLYIKNYRNLKELQIDSVAQVNLLCGKNNTGKSSVLEALGIYASGGDINYLVKIITQRGENVESNAEDIAKNKIILSLQSIFHGRNYNFDTKNKIKISENNGTIHSKSISMHFQKELGKRTCLNINDVKYYADDDIYQDVELNEDNFQFVTTGEIDSSTNAELFDTIVLSEKEDWVINALKIVEEKAERIAFVNEEGDRKPVIRTSSRSGIVPLQSMGDGINRILTIILAAVNCENGYLLIDEFENGLHYTVQEQLWKIIFKL